jgi:hypothetical protein
MRGPTDEQSSAKGALVSASRKRQVVRVWQDAASADAKAFGFANERLLLFGGHRPRIIEEKARIPETECDRITTFGKRHSSATSGGGNWVLP